MTRQRIDWQSIAEPNMYGWEATAGGRRAQVVRAYTSDWRVFAWIDGRTCKAFGPEKHSSASSARMLAGQFPRGEVTPETWPEKTPD